MSAAAAAMREPAAPPEPLTVYRDDGVIARAVGHIRVPLPAPLLALAAFVPLLAVVIITGGGASDAVAGVTIAWVLLVGGIATGRAGGGRSPGRRRRSCARASTSD